MIPDVADDKIAKTTKAEDTTHLDVEACSSSKMNAMDLSLSDRNSDTDGMDGSYSLCSSDFSSEAPSLPTTPTVSKAPPTAGKATPSLLELRKELRNKIYARRRSQGLDDITVEFKEPEPTEVRDLVHTFYNLTELEEQCLGQSRGS